MLPNERFVYLFERYRSRTCSAAEKQELAVLCLLAENSGMIEELLSSIWEQTPLTKDMPIAEGAGIVQEILQTSFSESEDLPSGNPEPTIKKVGWPLVLRRWAVAASIIGLVFFAGYWWAVSRPAANKNDKELLVRQNDVNAPASNRATVTLANGSVVYLDSAANGQLASQGNIQLVKLANGQIAYQGSDGQVLTALQYNTLSNPRGSKVINMLLADGSRVWLNAGSSVRYPVAFIGNERKVSITGEAYFEVAHDKAKPFYVVKDSVQVQVLGTHFNVNAFPDETSITVTLLEGRVEVSHQQDKRQLRPGEQALVKTTGIAVSKDVNLEVVMAWKNGSFVFDGTSLENALRDMARWYDLEVIYQSTPTASKLYGDISRNVPVSQVLRMLEATGGAHFKIEDKKVYVTK